MVNKDSENEAFDDAVASLREKAKQRKISEPPSESKVWVPKEISSKRSVWVLRGIIGLLVLAVGVETLFFLRNREELSLVKYQGGPSVESYADPAEIEIALPNEPLPALPEESPQPLPDGVQEIPFPTPSP